MPPSAPSGNSSCGKSSARAASEASRPPIFSRLSRCHARLLDGAALVDQAPHGRGALLMQGHLVLRFGGQYSHPALVAPCQVPLRYRYETYRPGRPARSSDDAGGTGSGPDPDQAAQDRGHEQSGRQPGRCKSVRCQADIRQSGRAKASRCQAGRRHRRGQEARCSSHHRPAPSGVRAAAAGHRARRDGRGRRPADGARE